MTINKKVITKQIALYKKNKNITSKPYNLSYYWSNGLDQKNG